MLLDARGRTPAPQARRQGLRAGEAAAFLLDQHSRQRVQAQGHHPGRVRRRRPQGRLRGHRAHTARSGGAVLAVPALDRQGERPPRLDVQDRRRPDAEVQETEGIRQVLGGDLLRERSGGHDGASEGLRRGPDKQAVRRADERRVPAARDEAGKNLQGLSTERPLASEEEVSLQVQAVQGCPAVSNPDLVAPRGQGGLGLLLQGPVCEAPDRERLEPSRGRAHHGAASRSVPRQEDARVLRREVDVQLSLGAFSDRIFQ